MNVIIVGFGNIGKKRADIILDNKIFNLKAIVEKNNKIIINRKEKYKKIEFYSEYKNKLILNNKIKLAIICVNPENSYKISKYFFNKSLLKEANIESGFSSFKILFKKK